MDLPGLLHISVLAERRAQGHDREQVSARCQGRGRSCDAFRSPGLSGRRFGFDAGRRLAQFSVAVDARRIHNLLNDTLKRLIAGFLLCRTGLEPPAVKLAGQRAVHPGVEPPR